jgi:hypothetical protein
VSLALAFCEVWVSCDERAGELSVMAAPPVINLKGTPARC